jgi:hypothetical protein
VTTMTPRQLAILRRYGGWMLADILINPDRGIAHAKYSRYGCSAFLVEGEEFWVDTTSRGIELSRWDSAGERRVVEVLGWPRIARFARALPAALIAELRAHREELTRSTVARPVFPVRATAEEQERWEDAEYTPWLVRRRAIEAASDAALDRALRDGLTGQPRLFDLKVTRPRSAGARATAMRTGPVAAARFEQDPLL